MADSEAVGILKQGRDTWKAWRAERSIPREAGFSIGNVDLRCADLRGVDVRGFDLTQVDFATADLRGALLHDADLSAAAFQGANLAGTDLSVGRLRLVDFEGADLTGAVLQGADLSLTSFRSARLCNAQLEFAKFLHSSLRGVDLRDSVCGLTVWGGVDLRGARNLQTVSHRLPSTIGVDTIQASAGEVPEVFLRGCGVSDAFIAYARSFARTTSPAQLYSCFISYSSHDAEFCQRLYADLQAAGVRCWFADKNLKLGASFRDEIENAIRLHDRLLLVLSEASVRSPWVRRQVEQALDREDRDARVVLWPVRLDDAILKSSEPWATEVRRRRDIGDFSHWKDPDAYKVAFDRLLRGFRATPPA